MNGTVPLRQLVEINPATPAFDELPEDAEVTRMPLEAVWNDSRADHARRQAKSTVSTGYVRFQPSDVLCPKVTPTFQAGRATLARSIGVGSTEIHVLRPRDQVDPRWVNYAVRSKHFLEEGVTAFQGVAGLQRVPPEFIGSFRISNRTFDDQHRIADFLDDRVARIDQIIAARHKQRTLVERMRMAAADSVLTGEDWGSATRFGYFIRTVEQGWSPQCESIPATREEWGVLKVGAVWAGQFRPDENKLLPNELEPQRAYEVHPGDLLVTRANTPERVGAVAVVPPGTRERLILCDKIMRVEIREGLSGDFVSLVGQTRRTRDLLTGAGTGTSQSMVNIRGDDIREIPMPILPEARQRSRVTEWRALTESYGIGESRLTQQIDLLTEYKQSLITAAVSGEFDVTTATTKLPEF